MSSDSSAAKEAAGDPSATEPLLDSSEELNNGKARLYTIPTCSQLSFWGCLVDNRPSRPAQEDGAVKRAGGELAGQLKRPRLELTYPWHREASGLLYYRVPHSVVHFFRQRFNKKPAFSFKNYIQKELFCVKKVHSLFLQLKKVAGQNFTKKSDHKTRHTNFFD